MTTQTRTLTFSLLCAVSIAFWWSDLVTTFRLAWTNDAYTHILLILPLVGALVYLDEKTLHIGPQPSLRVGVVLLVIALGIGCYARWQTTSASSSLTVGMSALALWWIASVLLCFGAMALDSLFFPLCCLFLIVPIPDFALSRIVEFLQYQSALAARIMFRMIGVPAAQDGIMLSIPSLDIEVARECSSIRSSMMLVVTTIVFAHLFLRSWWRKALLIAAAIPLSVAKNGLRIFTIAELGTRVDRGFLTGNLHHRGGIVFFGVSVVAMIALLWMLRRSEVPVLKSRPIASQIT
jgi:exosortase